MARENQGYVTGSAAGHRGGDHRQFRRDRRDEGCQHIQRHMQAGRREDLYAVYGIWSQTVHPSVTTSNANTDPSSGALQLTPHSSHSANVTLVAHCLIWAQRAFERLLPDPSRAQGLKNLASAIQALPVLPGCRTVTPLQADSSGGRRNRRRRANRTGSGTTG